jgi:hypothetical protein
MDETFDLNITATPEQIAGAVYGGLLATVQAIYLSQVTLLATAKAMPSMALAISTGKIEKFESPERFADDLSVDFRRRILTVAYGTVLDRLPTDSPFREPLEKRRDMKIAALKE